MRSIWHLNVNTEGSSLAELLIKLSGFSKKKIQWIATSGGLWSKKQGSVKRCRRLPKGVSKGDEFFLYYDEHILQQTPLAAECMADHKAWSAWFKPQGMPTVGSKWADHTAITRFIETHKDFQRTCFLVHRLDKQTSGVMLLAHDKKTAKLLSQLFEQRQIDKYYLAKIDRQHLDFFYKIPRFINHQVINKEAKTAVLAKFIYADYLGLLIKLFTGRKHQIRSHLSSENCPLIGDRAYGDSLDRRNLGLMAYRIVFICPISLNLIDLTIPQQKKIDFVLAENKAG